MLRHLEADGLVTVQPGAGDRRVRIARLTAAGHKERALLDARSDELAASFLTPLSDAHRARLVAAMADVERLLSAAMVEVATLDPDHPHAQHCLREYVAELDRRFPSGFDPARSISAAAPELRPPAGSLLVATLYGEPVACGALKFHAAAPAEIKRMWVAPAARGLGVGRRLVRRCHDQRPLSAATPAVEEMVEAHRPALGVAGAQDHFVGGGIEPDQHRVMPHRNQVHAEVLQQEDRPAGGNGIE